MDLQARKRNNCKTKFTFGLKHFVDINRRCRTLSWTRIKMFHLFGDGEKKSKIRRVFECNRLCHVKCLVDTDVSGCEVLFCSTCALSTQSTAEPYINGDSIYERLKEFAKMRGLKIIHQNINGLIRKLGMIDILLKETDRAIDIFAITETHLSRDNKDGELNLDNYTFVRKDRETGIGGGVGCFIREDIKWQRRIDLEIAGYLMVRNICEKFKIASYLHFISASKFFKAFA